MPIPGIPQWLIDRAPDRFRTPGTFPDGTPYNGGKIDYTETDPNKFQMQGFSSSKLRSPDFFSQLSPENMALAMKLLGPIFAQREGMLNRQQGNSLADASRGAGAYASSRGLEGGGLLNRARSGVYKEYAPQFGQLGADKQAGALGLLNNQYQSRVNQAGEERGLFGNQLEYLANQRGFDYQKDQNGFSFGDLFSGLVGGAAQVGAGLASGGFFNKQTPP